MKKKNTKDFHPAPLISFKLRCRDKLVSVLRETFLECVNTLIKQTLAFIFVLLSELLFLLLLRLHVQHNHRNNDLNLIQLFDKVEGFIFPLVLLFFILLQGELCCQDESGDRSKPKLNSKNSARSWKKTLLELNLETRFYLNFSNNILLKFS